MAVSEKSEEEEKGAEKILALRNPGDGLNIERMNSENGGDKSGAPAFAGEPVENKKKQHGVNDVQENVVEMVPAGGRFEKLAIAHV